MGNDAGFVSSFTATGRPATGGPRVSTARNRSSLSVRTSAGRERMAAATAGGAAGVQGLNRNGRGEALSNSPFILELLVLNPEEEDEGEFCHGSEGYMLTSNTATKQAILNVTKSERKYEIVDEDGRTLTQPGPVLGVVRPDSNGRTQNVVGSLVIGKNAVSVGDDFPLLFNYVALFRFQVIHMLPVVGGSKIALVRPYVDHPAGVTEEMDRKLESQFYDFIDEVQRREIATEGSVSEETKTMMNIALRDSKNRGRMTQLAREAIGFYLSNLLHLDAREAQKLFRSTNARKRTELALSILQRNHISVSSPESEAC